MKAAELFGGGMKGDSSEDPDMTDDDEEGGDEKSVREGYGKQAMAAIKSGDVPAFTEAITKLCKLAHDGYDDEEEAE